MKHGISYFFIAFLFLLFNITTYAQRVISLEECIEIAQKNSFDAQEAQNKFLQSTYQYKIYKKSYLPSLSLSGSLPAFNRSISKITLPNGDEAFVAQATGAYSGKLALKQPIPFLGSDFIISSGLQRLDLYNDSISTSYLSNVINLGISHSIFGYNSYKWGKKIEPLQYNEAKQIYVEEMEEIAKKTVELYFNLLESQSNLNIQIYNKLNIDTLLNIVKDKYSVGKCTEDEVLQLEVNLLNSELQILKLNNTIYNNERALCDFLRLDTNKLFTFAPNLFEIDKIDIKRAIDENYENSSMELNNKRQVLEAQSNLAKVKSENRVSVDLYATFGLSKNDASFKETFKTPLNQEVVTLSFTVPIFDFGISKSKIKQAELKVSNVILSTDKAKLDNNREIIDIINQINILSENIVVVKKTKDLAEKRYEISKSRYENGKIGFLDYSNAQSDKDKSTLDFLQLLRKKWELYYKIRKLTLYDFKTNQKITYKE